MNTLPRSELLRYIQQLHLPGTVTPEPSNRGVTDPNTPLVFSHLDYIQMTMQAPRQWGRDSMSLPFLSDMLKVVSGRPGIKHYRHGASLYPAGVAYWNEHDIEKPGLLVLAGNDLAIIRDVMKLRDTDILASLKRAAMSFTRLDFATNIDRGHPSDALRQWRKGKAETRVKNITRIDEHKKKSPGYTIYIGSRDCKKYIRCYDKAAELKVSDFVLTRIEMQLRDKPAHRLVDAMLHSGVKEAGKQAIRDFIKFPKLQWWKDATEGPEVEMQLTPRKETSFDRWLNEQVLRAIERRIEAGEELDAIERFTRSLMALHGEL